MHHRGRDRTQRIIVGAELTQRIVTIKEKFVTPLRPDDGALNRIYIERKRSRNKNMEEPAGTVKLKQLGETRSLHTKPRNLSGSKRSVQKGIQRIMFKGGSDKSTDENIYSEQSIGSTSPV